MNNNIITKFFNNKKVLITGHTGFKGSWLSIWLREMGAKVFGYSLEPNTTPSNFDLTLLANKVKSRIGDIRDLELLKENLLNVQPEIVIHLAAQSLVLESYRDPLTTYQTNILGLINLFETIRTLKSVKAALIVTSDKCYENKEWNWAYRETDELGGHDPYSSSKASAEIITASYRRSFFENTGIRVATARAGNVIGGGDWANNRIIPDCIRAITSNRRIIIRNPRAVRPWQHVLEPLSGYLWLIYNLLNSDNQYNEAWNFGPSFQETYDVESITKYIINKWKGEYTVSSTAAEAPEASSLKLDCGKAYKNLQWKTILTTKQSLDFAIQWYKKYYDDNEDPYSLCKEQIREYSKLAEIQRIPWALC